MLDSQAAILLLAIQRGPFVLESSSAVADVPSISTWVASTTSLGVAGVIWSLPSIPRWSFACFWLTRHLACGVLCRCCSLLTLSIADGLPRSYHPLELFYSRLSSTMSRRLWNGYGPGRVMGPRYCRCLFAVGWFITITYS